MTGDAERDEYGVPTGEHTATCGCKMEGRALLEPCVQHRAVVDRASGGYSFPAREGPMAMKMSTRPQDWAPPARAHLFGLDTLNRAELDAELRRRAAYPDRYPNG